MKQKITIGILTLVVIGVIANFLLTNTTKTGIIDEGTGVEVGDTPPQFKLENRQQEIVKLGDFQGKKVILNFWASWCLPCRTEMPALQSFSDTHDDVVVIAVNMAHKDSSRKKVESFLTDHNLTLPVVFDEKGAVSQAYSVINIPTTVFLGPDGKISSRIDGEVTEQSIQAAIDEM